ncbi:SRPBCC family protein [Pseudonocardia spinosispora]|uniref:SRPBCC family protein n=1 Tax=Pseudonocardia spinosispora TaxID=103441 RepID=UPI00041FF8E5|nr:SRPBCC family protein [Pseudonocardia spinosispora]
MTTTAPIPSITGTVTVAVPIDKAFGVFAGSIDVWWPHQFHIGAAEVAEVVLEPRDGGRWYERGVDGVECDWGRVLAWEPPHRLVFTWQINGMFQFDPDPAHASEIEARFAEDGPDQTVVTVEQRYFERLVGGQDVYDAIISGGGWTVLVESYAKTVVEKS